MRAYESFIEELRVLRAEIESLRSEPELTRSVPFKRWNHALCMLIGEMRKCGYRNTGCHVEGRSFSATSDWDTRDPAVHFNTGLDDTKIEIDSIISSYDKHGAPDPHPSVVVPAAALAPPLAPRSTSPLMPKPGDLTLDWVRTNVPFDYAKWGIGLISAFFLAGVALDRAFENIVTRVADQGARSAAEQIKLTTPPIETATSALKPVGKQGRPVGAAPVGGQGVPTGAAPGIRQAPFSRP